MAIIPKVLIIASILLSLLLLLLLKVNGTVQAIQTNQLTSNAVDTQKIDCGFSCIGRCKLSKRPNLCKRACGTCCFRCNCVPPGTYGNYEVCPCYAKLTTRGNKLKCP